MQIEKPTKEDLEQIIKLGTAGKSESDWVAAMLQSMKTILTKAPVRYRSYGPYWWAVKKMLIARGDASFGEGLDLSWFEQVDYGTDVHNIAAAYAYESLRFDKGLMDDPFHTFDDTDGNQIEYGSNDPEMEQLAFAGTMIG